MATAKRRQPPRQASGWQHYGAPAAFLVAVTVAVLLVRGSFGEHVRRTTTTASVPAATTTAPPATTAKPASQKPSTTPAAGAETYQVQAGDTFGSIAAEPRHDRRRARGAQPRRQLDLAARRPVDPRSLTSRLRPVRLRLVAALLAALALAAPAAATSPLDRVDARAFLVENTATGEVLASREPDRPLPIASITKLMTVLVVLEHAKLSDQVAIDPRAAAVGESSIPLRAGERLTVHDLIEAALIQSANNAADALALHVAGSFPAFARLMNEKARELGLAHTHFVRPDGLDAPGHVSTARDVTKLAWTAMRIPFVRQTVRRQVDTIAGGRTLHTWNDLLATFPHLLGVKTGHTAGAGWSQVAAARGRGTTIYATILGSPDRAVRNADLSALLAYGLSQYRVADVVAGGRVYATVRLPYGRAPLALVAERPATAVVRLQRPLVETVVAPAALALPVRKGRPLGEVRVTAGGKLVARRRLVAARSVGRPGLLDRAAWTAGRAARHAWGWIR